jgi:hypothetical protein
MSKKLSVEQLKQQASNKHNNIYGYDLWAVNTIRSDTVDIVCKIHGVFRQRLPSHIRGSGCQQCGLVKQRQGHSTLKQVKQRAVNIHNDKYDYSLWISGSKTTDTFTVICPIHDKFETTVHRHVLLRTGCRSCGYDSSRKGVNYFIEKAKIVHGDKYDYSLVEINAHRLDEITIVCDVHGKFNQVLMNHSEGAGCRVCAGREISSTMKRWLSDTRNLTEQHTEHKKSMVCIATENGISQTTAHKYAKLAGIRVQRFGTSSAAERQIVEFIESLGSIKIVCSDRELISPHEIDIFLPEYNIAIEYNGLYWHSEAVGKDQQYHINKTTRCEQLGIRLIHIFEDEWINSQQKCKDTIRHVLGKSQRGTYGRQSTIREIPWKQAKLFLDEYHLLSAGACGNYRIGAFDKTDQLIGVMVFGNQNNERSDTSIVELRRFVTNKKNNPGLGSKMFAYATNANNYQQVVAFVDRRWFTGLVKDHIGFVHDSFVPPSLWWTNGTDRHHRRFITKAALLVDETDKSLTKRELMIKRGMYRIWDCGKIKLKWSATENNK